MAPALRLTLAAADSIASGAVRAAVRNKFNPITATVLDPTGNVSPSPPSALPHAHPLLGQNLHAGVLNGGLTRRGCLDREHLPIG